MKFIIVGAGNVGLELAARLASNQHDVVVIEKKDSVIQRVPSSLDIQLIRGNACSTQILLDAGIKDADYLIAVSNNDEANISVCLLGKLINPATKRVIRLHDVDLQRRAIQQNELSEYFDLIIDPDHAGAEHLFRLLKVIGARDVVEFAGGKLLVLGVPIKENSRLLAKRLSAYKGAIPDAPFLILSIVRDGKVIVPSGKDRLRVGDVAYVATIPSKTGEVFELCGQKLTTPKFIVVWGGSPLALSLTDKLEKSSIQTKLIVPDVKDGDLALADRYKDTLVLHGDGTDMALLVHENIANADVFVAATEDEESNILGSILAKKLGAKSTMAMVNKGEYLPLLSTLGVDCVVNAKVAAASAIFRFIHAGSVLSELSIEQRSAGFVEIEINDKNPLLGKQLKETSFPNGILIAAIERMGEVFIPNGEDYIKAGDVVVIFLIKSEMRKLEKLLQVKIEVA